MDADPSAVRWLLSRIDRALDVGNRRIFMELTSQLKAAKTKARRRKDGTA